MKSNSSKKVIAVDLDGTLTLEKSGGWNDEQCLKAKPNQKMIDWVNKAWQKGNLIIIYTARRWSRREASKYWLQQHGVKYHTIEMEKLGYDLIVDDKAISSNDWTKLNSRDII